MMFLSFISTDKVESKSEYLCQRGRAYNVMPEYIEEGLQCLAKAVKLDPKLVDAWNNLGECYWKKKDVGNARNCFTGALNYVSEISVKSSVPIKPYFEIHV